MLAQLSLASVFASLLLLIAPGAATRELTAGRVNLRNDHWAALQVEVRVGGSDSCDTNESAGVRTLRRGQVWAVVVGGVVCWRHEGNPGDGTGVWTAWVSRRPVDATTIDVSL